MNLNNCGTVLGRLTQTPTVFVNRDGSRKIRFTVAASNNYRSHDGTRHAQFVPLEAFVAAGSRNSVFDMLTKGMLISASYEIRNNNWTDSSGQQHYDIVLACDSIRIQESRAVSEARRAAAAATA